MTRFLLYAIIAFILWKVFRLVMAVARSRGERPRGTPVDFPHDQSYKNIEDADFEDITRDPDKPS